jgi:uncharacterized protein (DUF305 family)
VSVTAFLGSVPFGPARYWPGVLRHHQALIDLLDPELHHEQRAELQRQAGVIANKVAAAYRQQQRPIFHWL